MRDNTSSRDVGRELLRSVHSGDLGPGGLIHAYAVQDGRKLVTVLGRVDLVWVSPEHLHAALLQS